MSGPPSTLGFRLMTLTFRIRDFLQPRLYVLNEAGIEPGFSVLDFGCGPGSYITPLAELVGPSGKIYALDIHPAAIKEVKKLAARKGIKNLEAIESDCGTGLPDKTMDLVLLYDTFHDLSGPEAVLQELYRVLKPDGSLSFSDHHMKEEEIISKVTNRGSFKLVNKGKKTYSFSKAG